MMALTNDGVITLHPGDVALGLRGERMQALLGTCVSVVLTDPRRPVGVMCHIVHASHALQSGQGSAAHADVALHTMVELLRSCGIVASMCEACVFGGGNMFPHQWPGPGVGGRNVHQALDGLDAPQTVAVPL
jgi:chemotaxis protein CheD